MTSLIIGGDGLIGSALHKRLGDFVTSRRVKDHSSAFSVYFGLTDPPKILPRADVVYIVAAMTKFRDCELEPDAWAVNVDAPIRIAAHFRESFVVYLSSEAAVWANQTAYGSQKRAAEAGLLSVKGYHRLAVVRPSKVAPERVESLVDLLETIGLHELAGVHTWK